MHAANAWLQFFGENLLAPLQQTRHEKTASERHLGRRTTAMFGMQPAAHNVKTGAEPVLIVSHLSTGNVTRISSDLHCGYRLQLDSLVCGTVIDTVTVKRVKGQTGWRRGAAGHICFCFSRLGATEKKLFVFLVAAYYRNSGSARWGEHKKRNKWARLGTACTRMYRSWDPNKKNIIEFIILLFSS